VHRQIDITELPALLDDLRVPLTRGELDRLLKRVTEL